MPAKRSIQDDMSDDDRDIDIESDDDDSDSPRTSKGGGGSSQVVNKAEKRAHHNALERKRRDHIKDSFTSLREAVPSLQGEKASRAQILKKAAEYIQTMRRKSQVQSSDIEDLKRENTKIENQIRQLERARDSYNGAGVDANDIIMGVNNHGGPGQPDGEMDSSEEMNGGAYARRAKKLKANGNF